jgi:hypothetical protein
MMICGTVKGRGDSMIVIPRKRGKIVRRAYRRDRKIYVRFLIQVYENRFQLTAAGSVHRKGFSTLLTNSGHSNRKVKLGATSAALHA